MGACYRFFGRRILARFYSNFECEDKFAAEFGFLYDHRNRILSNFHYGFWFLVFRFWF